MLNRFVLKSSRRFALLLTLVHSFALWSLWSVNLPFWARLGIALAVLLSLFDQLRRHVLLHGKQSWQAFSLDRERVLVIAWNGDEFTGEVSRRTVATPYVVLLRVKLDAQRLPVSQVIFPDALQADAFRELCVRLRFAQ